MQKMKRKTEHFATARTTVGSEDTCPVFAEGNLITMSSGNRMLDERGRNVTARLAVRGVSRRFGGVAALTDVSLEVSAGEVLGLVGDNGAGKSTLLKILAGALQPSEGCIEIDGVEKTFNNPHEAKENGISTVYQDLALTAQADVVSNFFLGREVLCKGWLRKRFGWLDYKAMKSHTELELARLGTRIPNVGLATQELSGGQRQALAIARAAAWTSKILLLDEPTSALGVQQQAEVLELIKRVRDHGIAVILVSHQMQDVMAVCDSVAVLRLGKLVKVLRSEELTGENLVGYITGAKFDGPGAFGKGESHVG